MSIILRALLLGLLLSGLGWCSAVGDAQAQTAEEMRRMVEEAKKAKAKGKGPAPAPAKASSGAKVPGPPKAKAAAPEEESPDPPPPAVEESKNLVKEISLRFTTDAECELKFNGQLLGKLLDVQPREQRVTPGKHQFECASAEFPSVNDTRMKTVADGEGRTVHFSLIWRVSEERRARLAKPPEGELGAPAR